MKQKNFKFAFLSGNMLKILAAVCMVCDHVGLMFFPTVPIFRIIGRIAFPIFAFMIAEGCKYTKNKIKYFGMIFLMGVVFQMVYYVVDKSLYFCIFITFSTSILMIYALQLFKKQVFSKWNSSYLIRVVASLLLFSALVFGVYVLNSGLEVFGKEITVDYGFWGCMLPVFASLLHADEKDENQRLLQKIDCVPLHVCAMAVGLFLTAYFLTKSKFLYQYYSLIAIIPLLLYSGKRGKKKMKYFFYVFYPAHLVLLYGLSFLLAII
ncbi:MAG: hypothetical protein IKA61_06775 [Clostridia bacterium]|nr:hypothetical protein [Clostridia bacterium]